MSSSRPIGVFDSGVGGLTVLRAIETLLPRENIVYFGDTAHVPYGTKSPVTVRRLVRAHMQFLRRRKVKCVVVACNTVSAVALDEVRRAAGSPVIGAIGPGVSRAIVATRTGRVGVIGTGTTIASGAYQRGLLRAGGRRIRVLARACPLFVPIAEAGWANHDVARRVAAEYLAPMRRSRVDTVILGCTHYPLLKPVLRRVMGREVVLVDSAEAMSRETRRLLAGEGLLRGARGRGRTRFFLTDVGGTFPAVARHFLRRSIGRPVKVGVKLVALSNIEKRR